MKAKDGTRSGSRRWWAVLAVVMATGSAAWGASSFTVSDLGADHASPHGGWEAIVTHVGLDKGTGQVSDAMVWAPLADEAKPKPKWSGGGGGDAGATLNSLGHLDADGSGKPGATNLPDHTFSANWEPQKSGGSDQIDLHVLKTGTADSAHGGSGTVVTGGGDEGSAVAVPVPAAAWTGLLTLAGLGGLAALRRYRLA